MNYSILLKMYSPDEIAKYIRLSLEDRRKGVKDESGHVIYEAHKNEIKEMID